MKMTMKTSLRQRLINNAKRNGKKMNPNGTKLADIIRDKKARVAAYKAERANRSTTKGE
jgi:hypothetical protein